jgi:hypothetical protein
MKLEPDSVSHSLDVLVIRKETTLATKVYRIPPTLANLNFKCNLLPHVERGSIQSQYNGASVECQEQGCLMKLVV